MKHADVFYSRARAVMRILIVLAGLPWFALIGRATPYYVATNGPGGGATTWATATNNIQDAISLCVSGDVVWVSNGVYQTGGVNDWPVGTALTNRVAITNAITVRSANNDPANTIIKGNWNSATTNGPDAVRCVYMVENSTLIGFTLTNGATFLSGSSSDHGGGGLKCESANPIISNCVITGNSADNRGGGTQCGTLYNCALIGNSATNQGGGTYDSILYNCTLTSNISFWGGGSFAGTLYNCTLTTNLAVYGGGVYYGTLSNCTLSYNSVQGGTYSGGGASRCTLYNCTLISNSAPTSYGGGGSECTMTNCTLIGNYAAIGGGGTWCTLYNCTLIGNSAFYNGGGTQAGTLYNCTLISNSTINNWPGGGVYYGTAYNCTLIANSAIYGGGANESTLYNCLLSGNRATSTDGGGAYKCTLYNCTLNNNYAARYGGGAYTSVLNNCIVYFNTAASGGSNWYASDPNIYFTNCCTTPAQAGWAPGNITGDPLFITNGSGYGATYVAGNYRLTANSPCINTGINQDWMTNSVDLDGRQRIRYGTVDMGVYEHIQGGTIFSFH